MSDEKNIKPQKKNESKPVFTSKTKLLFFFFLLSFPGGANNFWLKRNEQNLWNHMILKGLVGCIYVG